MNMREIQAVLFDFGGTLDSDGGHWFDRTQALYARRGLIFPEDTLKRAFYIADAACAQADHVRHHTHLELMHEHFERQLRELGHSSTADRDWLADAWCRETAATLARNRPLLERLAGRYRLGVLSNFYGNLRELCDEAGIAGYFAVLFDSAREGIAKPDPVFFTRALDRLSVPAVAAAMVGDNLERDVAPAKALGMKTFWLTRRELAGQPNPPAVDHRLTSLLDLEPLLDDEAAA